MIPAVLGGQEWGARNFLQRCREWDSEGEHDCMRGRRQLPAWTLRLTGRPIVNLAVITDSVTRCHFEIDSRIMGLVLLKDLILIEDTLPNG
jgi:hypothetical protein